MDGEKFRECSADVGVGGGPLPSEALAGTPTAEVSQRLPDFQRHSKKMCE